MTSPPLRRGANLAVIILTFNEELHLARALDAAWEADVEPSGLMPGLPQAARMRTMAAPTPRRERRP